MVAVHHRQLEIDGQTLFYREAGNAENATLVLLHGFPTSSYMFRHLIPLLAEKYRIIAPDHLGFGLSSAPSADEFSYTFEALADLTAKLLSALGVGRYAMYVQDYGAPIGWRLALRQPDAILAIISQNGNAYDEGFVDSFWDMVRAYQVEPNEETESRVRFALTLEATKWQYLTGVDDATLVDPESWMHDFALITRPGNDHVQLALFRDYATNPPMYPEVQRYFRESQVPLLAVWGKGDEIFGPAGAEAFRRDLPGADIHLLPGGHFLLESAVDEVAELIDGFLDRAVVVGDATERNHV